MVEVSLSAVLFCQHENEQRGSTQTKTYISVSLTDIPVQKFCYTQLHTSTRYLAIPTSTGQIFKLQIQVLYITTIF